MRYHEIIEAPLPDDWDKKMFDRSTPFKKMVAYAKERATQVGRGSSRVAFEIPYQGRKTVIKVALNRKGLAQNREEARLLSDGHVSSTGIVIPLIDYDKDNGDNPTWIHTEFANKIDQDTLNRYFDAQGTWGMWDIVRYLDRETGRTKKSMELPPAVKNNPYYHKLHDLVISHDLPAGDFYRKANWGLYNGKPVIIDMGYTSEVQKLYRK